MIEQIEQLKVYFDEADKSKTGSISPEVFLSCCDDIIRVKLSKDTKGKLFEMSDFDDNKSIDFQEVSSLARTRLELPRLNPRLTL